MEHPRVETVVRPTVNHTNLKDRLPMLIKSLKKHFPARIPEWWAAGTMVAWGVYVLLNPGIMDGPGWKGLRSLSWVFHPERFWGTLTLIVGFSRLCALFVNGAWSRTPVIRLIASAFSAFVWSQIALGFWLLELPSTGVVMYSAAVVLDFVSGYRASKDIRIAQEAKEVEKGDGRVRARHSAAVGFN